MSNTTKIAVMIALALSTSAAAAATKHATHRHQAGVVRHVPAAAYQSFGSVRGVGEVPTAAYRSFASLRAREPLYMFFQEQELLTGD